MHRCRDPKKGGSDPRSGRRGKPIGARRLGLIERNRAHGLLWTGMTASTLGSMATLYALLLYLALAAAGLLLAATSPRTVFVVAGAGVLAVLLLVRAMLPGFLDEADAE